MNMKNKSKKQKEHKTSVDTGDLLYEMVYDQKEEVTNFVNLNHEGLPEYKESVVVNGKTIYPFPASSDLVKNKAILFASEPVEYGNEATLLKEIQTFIHRHLEVSEFFERITPYYVLFSWMYDKFKELPYLRAIGDYGCGKSRFLKVIGSACYKPMFTVGATTSAPIFRIISQFRGTLILDEADLRFSDTNNDIVKILNSGFQDGNPVMRCSGDDFEVKCFQVFGPKVVATRNKFQDQALESRFLIEYMDGVLTREDIPLNLDEEFDNEAHELRNKCLLWRLRNYSKTYKPSSEHDHSIEPRLNQIIAPLISIIDDAEMKKELRAFIKKHHDELKADRGFSFEAPILDIIIDLAEIDGEVKVGEIAQKYNLQMEKGEKELSARKMGNIVRNKFRLKTIKKRTGYIIDPSSYQKNIERLKKKYGVTREHVNVVHVVGDGDTSFKNELKELGCHDLPQF